MKVVWSPLAIQKLGAVADFIALDKPSAAEQWVNDIFNKTDLLAITPEMGRLVPELCNRDYREIIFGNYRVIYSVTDEIRILTIRNCRQILSEDDL